MNTEEYLNRIQAEIKGLAPEEQAALLEEIAAHLEEGAADPRMGIDPTERKARLSVEMGSAQDLGRGLKNVHRPNRWVDYLLIVIPGMVVFPLLTVLMSLLFPNPVEHLPATAWPNLFWGIRISILLHVILVGISFWRNQSVKTSRLLFYWLPAAWLTIFSMCFREKRWLPASFFNASVAGGLESIFWLVILFLLAAWLLIRLWRERDPMLAALACLPFFVAVGNIATGEMIAGGGFPNGYPFPNWRIAWYFGPTQVAEVIWPALFFLTARRAFRWMGLLVLAAPLALMNLVASAQYPYLAVLWSLPIVLVLTGWLLDQYNEHRKPELIR